MTINADSTCQIIAEEAVPVDHIDGEAAKAAFEEQTRKLSSAAGEAEKAEAEIGVDVARAMCFAVGKAV